ncbi:MAG: TlpA disulfide reductase family protein [Bacteroidota bacterium]
MINKQNKLPAVLKAAGLLFISTFLLSCSGEKEHSAGNESIVTSLPDSRAYYISGTVVGPPKGLKVYLNYLGDSTGKAADSTMVNEKGGFDMSGKVPEYGMYTLKLTGREKPEYLMFPLDSEDVHVEFAGSDRECEPYAPAKPTGKETANYAKLYNWYIDFSKQEDKMLSLFEAADALPDKNAAQKRWKELRLRSDSLENTFYPRLKNEIIANPLSPVSVYFTSQLSWGTNIPFITELSEKIKAAPVHNTEAKVFLRKAALLLAAQPGKPAPELSLRTPRGKPWKMSSIRGKVTVLDFWASWCGPCREQSPKMVALYNKYRGNKNFAMVGISLDVDSAMWVNAIAKDRLTWLQVSDLDPMNNFGKVSFTYALEGVPTVFLINEKGIIVGRDYYENLDAKIEELLAKK